MSSTETLIPVDAALAEESVPGYTDKDSTNSSTPDTSASSHEDEAAEVNSYPRGYARLAASHDCHANFSIYRKYGWLHNRVLLYLQAELPRLEWDLQLIDDEQAEKVQFKERKGLWCDRLDNLRRKNILAEIKTELAEYDDLVFRLQKKNGLKRPANTNQNSVTHNACQNVVDSEAQWTFRAEDLVALADGTDEHS
ncbi:MAG: hypothetical protein Q9161_001536 [Pseudevernia consocians]